MDKWITGGRRPHAGHGILPLSTAPASEAARHERIDTVIEATTLRCMYDLRTEHDFSHLPQQIDIGSPVSLLAPLIPG